MNTPLVTTTWLETHLNDVNLKIIDIRGKVLPASQPPPHYFSHRSDYAESHIPNAIFVDWMVDIIEPNSPSNDIASPERFANLMGQLGIDNESLVVIYDDAQSMFASRMWWALRYYGHEQVAVLDGGWQKWIAEERPTDANIPEIAKTKFVPIINRNLRATVDDILPTLESASIQLIDVRSPKEFAGDASRASRFGHIPTAINLPRKTMVANDSTLLDQQNLMDVLEDHNVDLEATETVIYCNSGVSASYGLLAMTVLGAEKVRVYDGSWKEWGNDDTKPIA